MKDRYDIVVIGAGAAGLAAGIAAGEVAGSQDASGPSIVLLEGSRHIGAKLLLTGGGRCNLTHERVCAADYYGSPNIIRNVLAGFDKDATVRWFEQLGVRCVREETGKFFPASNTAQRVVEALVDRCSDLDVAIHTGHRVHEVIAPAGPGEPFRLRHEGGEILCARLILCTGGRSWPQTGSNGQGLEMAAAIGHAVSELTPGLVPLILKEGFFHKGISGVAQEVTLSIFADGKRVDRRTGSLLWTHFGISGPVVLDASRHWALAHKAGRRVELRCSFWPEWGFEKADQWLTEQALAWPNRQINNVLSTRLPHRLAEALVNFCNVRPDEQMNQLRREHRRTLSHALTELVLPVAAPRGWEIAEVTVGGVPLCEIDYRTMESRKVAGLYLAGEMLECDGRSGGFNLQWAWTTGHLAGRAAASRAVG